MDDVVVLDLATGDSVHDFGGHTQSVGFVGFASNERLITASGSGLVWEPRTAKKLGAFTGHPGGMATVHANDAMSGLIRLESLVAEATSAPQQTLIAEAVDLVIFVDEEPEIAAGRKVREVLLVTGYSNGNYQVERI